MWANRRGRGLAGTIEALDAHRARVAIIDHALRASSEEPAACDSGQARSPPCVPQEGLSGNARPDIRDNFPFQTLGKTYTLGRNDSIRNNTAFCLRRLLSASVVVVSREYRKRLDTTFTGE